MEDRRPQWRASLSTYITDGAKSLARSGRNERDGVMAVIQYRPSKTWTSMLDMYASRFKRKIPPTSSKSICPATTAAPARHRSTTRPPPPMAC
ncbi:hypothetical protein LP419_27480 [Massilia sp. H-1]|nr:hypothetical protein LP419_27480 [Massilia sp. H-1]